MSWTEKINTGLIIITGDGKVWTPLYINSPQKVPYNIAEFNFPNVDKTLVVRSRPQGFRMTMEFIFQGDDHLDKTELFRKSADDSRYWTISHPMFGKMFVQPSAITYDNTGLNLTRITAELLETITQDYPRISQDLREQLLVDLENLFATSAEAFGNRVTSAKTTEVTLLDDNLTASYNKAKDRDWETRG